MFINKGESILNNKGIIISIGILILILLFNYNKCYTETSLKYKNNSQLNTIEKFNVNEEY